MQQRQRGDDDNDDYNIVTITLPAWATTVGGNAAQSALPTFDAHHKFTSDNEMMSVAISLSDTNVKMESGGPFGAAIFERHYYSHDDDDAAAAAMDAKGKDEKCSLSPPPSYCTLVSIGMNRVVPMNNSTCHGEMVAIQLAQKKMGSFSLNMMMSERDTANNDKVVWDNETSNQPRQRQRRQFELFTSCEPCAMCLGATLWSGVSRIVCAATRDDAQSVGFDEGPVYESSYAHLESCGVKVTKGVMKEEAQQVLRKYAENGLIYNR